MSYVIRSHGLADGRPHHSRGKYLVAFDPNYAQGRGMSVWTGIADNALAFDTLEELFDLWRSVPDNRPTRPDGRPNRPLTAFNIEPVKLP